MSKNYSNTVQFVLSQIPGIQICYRTASDKEQPDWPLTLKCFLDCNRDYERDLKKELETDDFNKVRKALRTIVNEYITNGEMSGPNNFKVMTVNRNAINNRVASKAYHAYKDGVDITKGLKTTIQSYASPYCMRLTPKEERAICVLYRAAKMDQKNPNEHSFARDNIFELAYTFFCLRVRKTYAIYEKALLKCNVIEDGLLATTYGFSVSIDEYDFNTPLETGMGPDRLGIPIRNEIKNVLKEANEFTISDATWRKIFAYDGEKHKGYTREQLAKEFHAAPATVDMMLLYGNGGLTSLDGEIVNEEADNSVPLDRMLGENEEGFFYTELYEVLDKVLDDDQRAVFDNVFFNGMTYKEIAAEMDLPERKVKYLFELCRKKLAPYYDTGMKKKKNNKKTS